MSEQQASGKTTIAPEVLVTIARLTALSVTGVSRLSPVPGDIGPLLKRDAPEGVRIVVDGNTVLVDLGYALARAFPRHDNNLANLTVWTMDKTVVDS